MRRRHLIATGLVVVAVGGATAYADHVQPVDPETVPLGVFAAHNKVSNISTAALVRATKRNRADVTIQHARLAPGQATAWHTHPGPGLVTVVKGSLTYEDARDGECTEIFYPAGRGFMDRGFGHVHRVVAGDEGADFYIVYVHPRGAGNPLLPAEQPPECAE
jgi:hypothetical protein